ncbi:hypothetical protein FBQ97_05655, partial [Acidobacteria bacterium ACD]|nr:hypothetical protein [Acidobacteria bacterium ACD]
MIRSVRRTRRAGRVRGGTAALLVLAGFAPAPALALDPGRLPSQHRVRVYSVRDGLPQSSVESLAQTPDGYLWLGTQEGVARFDGVRFAVFDRRTVPEIAHNRITALHVDGAGALWIGTEGGGVTLRSGGAFRRLGAEAGLPNLRVRAFAPGPGGGVWVGTDGGLVLVREGRAGPVPGTETLAGEGIESLAAGRDGSLWVGTRRRGLMRLSGDRLAPALRDAFPDGTSVPALHVDSRGDLWAGSRDGLSRIRDGKLAGRWGADQGVLGGPVAAIATDPDGNVWFGPEGGGLNRLAAGRVSRLTASGGLPGEVVESLLVDREGSLWAGTQDGGVARLCDGAFVPWGKPEGLLSDVASPILEDQKGAVWVGTRGGGVSRIAGNAVTSFTTREGLPNDWVQAIAQTRDGSLLVGTRHGMARLSGGRFVPFGVEHGLANDGVRAILETRDGALWVGTGGAGLVRIRGREARRFLRADGLPNESVFFLHEDDSGVLWIATNGGGLVRWDGTRFTALTTRDGLTNDIVNTLHETADGTLWIGTYGGGLCRLRGGRVSCVTTRNGLHDDAVFRILEDDAGRLWVSCNRGVWSVPLSDLDAVADGRATTVTPRVHGTADGMRNAECNGADMPTGWKARDGRLWFPTIEGAVVVDPAKPIRSAVPPTVLVERIVADGEEVPLSGGEVVLPPGTEKLEVDYTAPSFRNPERVRFRYRLAGYEERFADVGSRRTAFYTHLPHGAHVFEAVAVDEDGVESPVPARVPVRLTPFFHQTPLFYLLAAAAVLAAGAGAWRYRVARLLSRERELEALVARRTESLRQESERTAAALREAERQREIAERATRAAEEASQTKSQFIASTSHEIRTPLNAIIGYTELIEETVADAGTGELREDLVKIRQAARHLLGLINDILDLSKIEAGKLDLHVEDVPVAQVLAEVRAAAEPLAQKNGNRLVVAHEGPA